jgi:hypothetical protein
MKGGCSYLSELGTLNPQTKLAATYFILFLLSRCRIQSIVPCINGILPTDPAPLQNQRITADQPEPDGKNKISPFPQPLVCLRFRIGLKTRGP